MRWPFVPRSLYDARETMLLALLTAKQEEYRAACARYDALLDKYAALLDTKLPVAVPPREKRKPDEADTAIDFACLDGDPTRRRYLERYAAAERKKGTDPKEIAAEILDGDRSGDEEGVPG